MVKKGALLIGGSYDFDYELKHFDKPSEFGIEGGRISKLSLKFKGKFVAVYDRGWVIKPKTAAAQEALQYLMERYN